MSEKTLIKSGRNLKVWDHERGTDLNENRPNVRKGHGDGKRGYRSTRPVTRLKWTWSHGSPVTGVRAVALKLGWTVEPPGEFLSLLMPRSNFESIKTNSGNEIQASALFTAPRWLQWATKSKEHGVGEVPRNQQVMGMRQSSPRFSDSCVYQSHLESKCGSLKNKSRWTL